MFKWYKDLKISVKLMIGFGFIALIAAAVGVIGFFSLNSVGNADLHLYEVNMMGIENAANANINYQKVRVSGGMVLIDGLNQSEYIQDINDYTAKVDEYLGYYNAGIITETDGNNFNTVTTLWQQYKDLTAKMVTFLQAEANVQATNMMLGEITDVGTALEDAFNVLITYNTDDGREQADNNKDLVTTAKLIMIAVVLAGVLISVLLGLFISRLIGHPITILTAMADMLKVGDINIEAIEKDKTIKLRKDEIGRLAGSFDELVSSTKEQTKLAQTIAEGDLSMDVAFRSENDLLGKGIAELIDKFNSVVETIVLAAEQVASGSEMVSQSSAALSQGATEQASSIEQLTASLETILYQTNHNAENADKANELARNAETNAIEGNNQMKDMLTAMTDINEASANINKIIKVIDDIAFQTNILALNAAVEAARAGQHGKGFAVVAEEVRSLAARSAGAVKETAEMIESSIRKVEAGTRIANNTAQALNKIVEQVKKAAELVGEIAEASKEQTLGVSQINDGIAQVSKVVQTNAATSQESAAASEELSTQAAHLKDIVSIFKLRNYEISKKTSVNKTKSVMTPALPDAPVKISVGEDDFGKY
jgi:methyl-accepting chemotaxis protein